MNAPQPFAARSFVHALAALALLATGSGCAGARARVVAADAAVPVSMSPAVRGAEGTIVPQRELLKVGAFHYEGSAWSLFYTAIPLSRRKDISEAVTAQAKAAGGEAVVNLTIRAKTCPTNFIAPFTWLPVWPGCSKVEVTGDIVRRERSPASDQETMLATAGAEVFLHDRCALVDEPDPDHDGSVTTDARGRVRSRAGTFLCTELPPGLDDEAKAKFAPAALSAVLCRDTPRDRTCLAPRDPSLAARYDAELAAQAAVEPEVPSEPLAVKSTQTKRSRRTRNAR